MYFALCRLTLCIIKHRFFFSSSCSQTYIGSKGFLMRNTPLEWLRANRSAPPGELADMRRTTVSLYWQPILSRCLRQERCNYRKSHLLEAKGADSRTRKRKWQRTDYYSEEVIGKMKVCNKGCKNVILWHFNALNHQPSKNDVRK